MLTNQTFFGPTAVALRQLKDSHFLNQGSLYCLGFAIDALNHRVAMVKKNRGMSILLNRYNGIGGHVEHGESPIEAQSREFHEEAGVYLPTSRWELFGVSECLEPDFRIYAAKVYLQPHEAQLVRTMTDEPINWLRVEEMMDPAFIKASLAPDIPQYLRMAGVVK